MPDELSGGSARTGCESPDVGSSASSAQYVPGGKWLDDPRVLGGLCCEEPFEPRHHPLQVFVPLFQGAGVYEHVAQVVEVPAGRKLVEHLVRDRLVYLCQPSQEGDGVALAQPSEDRDWMLHVDEGFEHWIKLRMYRAVLAREQDFHPLLEHASAALAVRVLPPSLPAAAAEVAEVSARA